MKRAAMIAQRAGDLPSLPHVAVKVMNMISDPNTNASTIGSQIYRDQALTAKILKLSNSAMFGLRGRISTISHAISILGFNAVQSLVIAASTESLYRVKDSSFKEKILWEHSLATGLGGRLIARELDYPDSEMAFVGGLLHDIGKTILDRNLGDQYQAVVMRVYNEEATFLEAEQAALGFDHTEVGSLVARKWNLAPPLIESIQLHHQPQKAEIDPPLCAIICLANALCVKLSVGPEKNPDLELMDLDAIPMLKIDAVRLTGIVGSFEQSLKEEKNFFSMT